MTNKKLFWICYLVVLIDGDFWRILSPLICPIGKLWTFLGAYKSKCGPHWPVLPLLDPLHPEWPYKRLLLIHFLVVLIYGGFWEVLGPLSPVELWKKWPNLAKNKLREKPYFLETLCIVVLPKKSPGPKTTYNMLFLSPLCRGYFLEIS